MKIILLEDDPTLSFGVRKYLESEGHMVVSYFSMAEAMRSSTHADLFLVDVSLPDGLGYDYVSWLRKQSSASVIFLTARDDEASVLQGFDTGGDDYITKPFSLKELKRRIDAIARRTLREVLTCSNLIIDTRNALVHKGTEVLNVTVQEYRILVSFLRADNQFLSRETLNALIWNQSEYIEENTLNVTMRRLRAKLQDCVRIESVHGKGYRITP